MIGFTEVQHCQYRAWHRVLLEAISYCLDYISDLIFTAPTFTKPSLELTEQILRLSQVVKTISKYSF